jgi:predicted transcriptional regulator
MNPAVGLLAQIQELLSSPSLTNGRRHDAEEALAVAVSVLSTSTEPSSLLTELEQVVAELRRRLAPTKRCLIADEHLAQLQGIPEEWRLIATGAEGNTKRPLSGTWNTEPRHRLRAPELVATAGALGAGLHTGTASGGLLVVDFDSPPWDSGAAERAFESTFGRSSAALPPTLRNTSGKEGRFKVFLRVPREFWALLPANWKAPKLGDPSDPEAEPKSPLEVLWQRSNGASLNAVICGEHPQSTPEKRLFFRWVPGCTPAEVGWAAAPEWLLTGLVALMIGEMRRALSDAAERESEVGEGIRAWEHLNSGERRKLQKLVLKHSPNRLNRGSGTHDDVNKVLLGTWREMGEDFPETERLLRDSGWEATNEWESGVSMESALRSIATSQVHSADGKRPVFFPSVITLAKEIGNSKHGKLVWPKWALPPKEINADTLTTGVAKKLAELEKALTVIEAMDSPLERECAYQNLAKILDCSEKELRMLLRHTQEAANPVAGGDWNEVIKRAKPIEVAVERLLAFNALTIVASDGGVGKSVLIYRLAEAAANGGLFAGHLNAVKGKVLIVQKDESDSNLAAKNALMQAHMPDGMVRVEFSFNGGMLPELRKWIRDHGARYVFMDSLFSLFGSDGDLSESAIGTYMYLLNDMAAQENCAIVLTHHLRKGDKSKAGKRAEIHNQDLYGSSFIVNGTSDVWGIIRDPEANSPTFLLKVLKPRSGITSGGDTFKLSGSLEDLSFELETVNNITSKDAIEGLRKSEQKVLTALRERTGAETGLSKHDLAANTGVSPSGVEKALTRLLAEAAMGVKRAPDPNGGGSAGRPGYVYWAG